MSGVGENRMSGGGGNNLNNINALISSPLILSVGSEGAEVEGLGEVYYQA
jgi:hypothetical protein